MSSNYLCFYAKTFGSKVKEIFLLKNITSVVNKSNAELKLTLKIQEKEVYLRFFGLSNIQDALDNIIKQCKRNSGTVFEVSELENIKNKSKEFIKKQDIIDSISLNQVKIFLFYYILFYFILFFLLFYFIFIYFYFYFIFRVIGKFL